ncbi:MAG: dockerin type I repeat-containing protein [Ruminococcus sp.]|nr:dockerin type I repeat-containing protein [Ruminococcus sp.]
MKRFLCVLCSLMILFGVIFAAIPASAEELSPSGSSSKIYFDTANTGWRDYQRICCYLYDYNDGEIIVWGSKKGYCTDEGDGIWSLDLDEKGISLYEGGSYSVIFSADWSNGQTYPLLLDSTCYGDTAYFTGNMIENPADSTKICCEVKWKNADPSRYGPVLLVTSIGNVAGSVCAPSTSPYMMYIDFLKNYLPNARMYSGKDDQTLLDDTASALGLSAYDVEKAIAEAGVSTQWDRNKSALPDDGTVDDPGFGTTVFAAFCRYLSSNEFAEVVRQNPGKSDQQLIDEAGQAYGMYQDDVERALSMIGAGDVGWSKENSTLPEGISGYQYTVGAYYLVLNYKDGETYVDEKRRMTYDENSGYYTIRETEALREEIAEVVQFNEDHTFSVVTKKGLEMPGFDMYLFFFRPQSEGYNFGFNFLKEYRSNYGTGSSSGGTSSNTVKITKVEDDVKGVKVSWDAYGAAKYEVYFSDDNGNWKSLGQVADMSFVDTTAQSGDVIAYSVRALNAKGEYISDFHTYPPMHRYIGAPKITALSSTAEGVMIYLSGVSGNARYRIYVRDGILWKAIGDTYGTSFLHRAKEKIAPVYDDSYPRPSEAYAYNSGSSDSYYSSDVQFADIPAEEGQTYNYRVRCVSYDGYTEVGAYITDAVGTQYNPPKPQYILGDVDGDKVISVIDATKIQKFRALILTENDIDMDAADVDGDGVVSVIDATRIQKFKAQICNLDGSTPYQA